MGHVRQPRMYLDHSRICCKCGSNKTNDKMINRVFWHRDNDDNGKWTGKWKCNKCYQKEYAKKRCEENDLMRQELIENSIKKEMKKNDA